MKLLRKRTLLVFLAASITATLLNTDLLTSSNLLKASVQTPDKVDWTSKQTSIKNQYDRNTCFDFAIIAGIEARYKRDYNLNLDLSEQYFHHLVKSTSLDASLENNFSPTFKYENQSSIWGGGNSDCVTIARDYDICLESDINYNSSIGVDKGYLNESEMQNLKQYINKKTNNAAGNLVWNPSQNINTVTQSQIDAFEYSPYYIPISARSKAVKYGVEECASISSPWVSSNIEKVLAEGYDVIITFSTQWKLKDGVYQYDSNANGGAHCVLIVGYDRPNRTFIIKNSWGGTTMTKVKYDVFEETASQASYIKKVRNPNTPNFKGKLLGMYNMDHDGWKGKLIIRRNSSSTTRLGQYIDSSGNCKAVNGFSIDNGRGIKFAIGNSRYSNPTVISGQEFYTDIYSWDGIHMAGYTTWSNMPFGVFLSRTENFGKAGEFNGMSDWAGTWNMNHDGWSGRLIINSKFTDGINRWNVTGLYYDSKGVPSKVTGYILKSKEYIANLKIYFSSVPQNFTLMYHTREDNLFSGYTYCNGLRYGVYGIKQDRLHILPIKKLPK